MQLKRQKKVYESKDRKMLKLEMILHVSMLELYWGTRTMLVMKEKNANGDVKISSMR